MGALQSAHRTQKLCKAHKAICSENQLFKLWIGRVSVGLGVALTQLFSEHASYIEVRDQVEMGGHTFWPFSMN